VVVLKKRGSSEAPGDGGSVEKQARAFLFIFCKTIGIFYKAALLKKNENKKKARAPRKNTKHLNPSRGHSRENRLLETATQLPFWCFYAPMAP
jgi:hypothetical protein